MVRNERTKPPFTLFYNDEAKYTNFLRSFGEMAVIAISDGKKMRSKLDTRGRTGIFVGYADNHAWQCLQIYLYSNAEDHLHSRDIQWLYSFWKEYKKIRDDSKKLVDVFYSHDEDDQRLVDVFYSHDEDDQIQEESEADELHENEEEETNNSGDGNNTEEQKRLGIDIQMMLKNLNSQLYSTSLVLSLSLKQLVYMYLSQLMSTFTNYLKVHHSLDGYFIL